MKVEYIEKQVAEISTMIDDDEAAHACLDRLYVEVLTAIASGQRNAKALAEAALKAEELGITRYTA